MQYYYLNEQREVQGPFTAEQMRCMLADGTLDGQTLASEEGGSGWQPLDSLHLPGGVAPEVLAAVLGECPHCKTTLVGAEVPAVCPHCGKHLHPGTESLWENAMYAYNQLTDFRGRATRREFWSYYLFFTLVGIALNILGNIGEKMFDKMQGDGDVSLLVDIVLMVAGLLLLLFQLSLILANLAVTVRRLHDTGHSGWWVVAPLACLLVEILGILLTLGAHDRGMMLGIFALVAVLAAAGFGIYLLIQMLMPSQCGPNKYGPSPRLAAKGCTMDNGQSTN